MAEGERLLKLFRGHYEQAKDRYKVEPFLDYYSKLLTGKQFFSARNAFELTFQALTTKPPVYNPAGYNEYPCFTEGESDLALFGVPRSIDRIMTYLQASAALGSKDRMLLLIAPSGAGKSTAIKLIIDRLERYTGEKTPPPVFAIKDCPVNEDPLHLLDNESRKVLESEYGVSIKGELCPDCEQKKRKWLASSEDDFPFAVEAMQFSSKMGQGITRLESELTRADTSDKQEIIKRIIRGSNRGILHIPEFFRQDSSFIESLNDFIRGRKLVCDNTIFELDNVIIGDATTNEWNKFQKEPVNRPLLERIEPIFITYPLSRSEEVKIYERHIKVSSMTRLPHFSPRVWLVAAEYAVRTRYKDCTDDKRRIITPSIKVDLYDGKDVGDFKQSDRREIEAESQKKGEGLDGISPQAMLKIIDSVIAVVSSDDKSSGCVDATGIIKTLKEEINANSFLLVILSGLKDQLKTAEDGYNNWLTEMVEQAFQDNFPDRANSLLTDYIDQCELFLTKEEKPDGYGEFKGADVKVLKDFEDYVKPGLNENERRELRQRVLTKAGKITKKENRVSIYTDFPEFGKGVKDQLTAGTGDPKDVLRALPRTEKQVEKIGEVVQRLIVEYDFCKKCAPDLVDYVSRLQREKDNKLSL